MMGCLNRYVSVGNNVSIIKQSFSNGICRNLISLHYGAGVDRKNIDKFIQKLNDTELQQHIKNNNGELYIDSGGYSIIAGTIKKEEIYPFIDNYFYFLEETNKEKNNTPYNFIFSLDIPLSLKLDINYYDYIYNANRYSQEKYISLYQKYPNVKNHSIFVWHFKTPNLFEIWNKIFYELNLYQYYDKYAIGGLVGLKNMANADHSPWVLMIIYIFSILRAYNKYDNNEKVIRLHLLGQGASFTEHITVPIIEEFARYIFNLNTHITFDSVYINRNFMILKEIPILEDNFEISKAINYNIIDLSENKITDNIKAQALLYKTYLNIQKYSKQKLSKPILIDLLNINNENHAVRFLNKWRKYLLSDKVLSHYLGNGVIDTIIRNLQFLARFIQKYKKNKSIINDTKFLQDSLYKYLKHRLKFSEVIKR